MTYWTMGVFDNKIYMVADIRVSKESSLGITRDYADVSEKLVFLSYESATRSRVSIGLCTSGATMLGDGHTSIANALNNFLEDLKNQKVDVNDANVAAEYLLKYCQHTYGDTFDAKRLQFGIGIFSSGKPTLAMLHLGQIIPTDNCYLDMYFGTNPPVANYVKNRKCFMSGSEITPPYETTADIPLERLTEVLFVDRNSGRRQEVSENCDYVVMSNNGIVDQRIHPKKSVAQATFSTPMQYGSDRVAIPRPPLNVLQDPSRMSVPTRMSPPSSYQYSGATSIFPPAAKGANASHASIESSKVYTGNLPGIERGDGKRPS